jgi:hypothetical protein
VLLRGGLRAAAEADRAGVLDMDAVGEGVEVSDISSLISSICILATVPSGSAVSLLRNSKECGCDAIWTTDLIWSKCIGRTKVSKPVVVRNMVDCKVAVCG